MEQLLGSLVTRFNEGLEALQTVSDTEQRKILVDFLNNVMAYARYSQMVSGALPNL